MKVIFVCGSRTINDSVWLEGVFREHIKINDAVIHGGCTQGVDAFLANYCLRHNISTKIFRPDRPHVKQDYILRNLVMAKLADEILIIWDGKSHGTKSVFTYAKSHGKKYTLRHYDYGEEII